jgi:SPP1 gp7 family putative phage head morphogenesis protein
MPSNRQRENAFEHAKRAEATFAMQLRKIADQAGAIIKAFPDIDLENSPKVVEALTRYSDAIDPYAQAVSNRMISELNRRNRKAWRSYAAGLHRGLVLEIDSTPLGSVFKALMAEQVTLIKSIPLDAAQRVHKLAMENYTGSKRAGTIASELMRSSHVSRSAAMLIARTESTRAATTLTQARATHIQSDGYIWRTSKDEAVRPSHRRMEGKFVRWDTPPTLDRLTGHAGCVPNCRCYPEPVIPQYLLAD